MCIYTRTLTPGIGQNIPDDNARRNRASALANFCIRLFADQTRLIPSLDARDVHNMPSGAAAARYVLARTVGVRGAEKDSWLSKS